jgi:hypothetical protein
MNLYANYVTTNHHDIVNISDISQHLNTKNQHFVNKFQQISTNFNNSSSELVCSCGKVYKERTGLWRHKKKCKKSNESHEKNDNQKSIDKDELIIQLLKQNAKLMEILENGTHNTTNNTTNNTNSHNKAFNLNFFLNETCKNAMNITDFVDSIKLQLSDLIDVGTLGYVEGISKIIVKNLNDLDETKRPIHCVDKKRETMYVKDKGQWEKDDEKKTKLTKAVKRVADKNINLLPQFREKYPDYNNSSSKTSDKYEKMVIEVMTTDEGKNDKVIKKISNVTLINKE